MHFLVKGRKEKNAFDGGKRIFDLPDNSLSEQWFFLYDVDVIHILQELKNKSNPDIVNYFHGKEVRMSV